LTPLPPAVGGPGHVCGWRLDSAPHAPTWDSGIGAAHAGARWNSRFVKAVYASLDPATAIIEVAVHKGFKVLDTVRHVLTCFRVTNPADIHVVTSAQVPNRNWLHPGTPSAGQQAFGDALLAAHKFILIPSAVSTHSWNLIFSPSTAAGAYILEFAEDFALDTRLHPPPP
jgi:RES domain-containing protein